MAEIPAPKTAKMVKKSTRVNLKHLTQSVIRVGDGRGFVVEIGGGEQVVITAAHCLPFFPPCHAGSYLEERTYKTLLSSLGAKPTIWAECLFADPISDIAVIGKPDSQALSDEADAYRELVASTTPFLIADAPKQGLETITLPWSSGGKASKRGTQKIKPKTPRRGSGLVLSLGGDWVECSITRYKDGLSIEPAKLVDPGMSGSPILSVKGQAIGVVSIGGSGSDLNAVLTDNLPMKFLSQALTRADRR